MTADNQHVKLCDFGLADRPPYHNYVIQTVEYRSPEVLLGMARSPKVDIWSFGCVVFELCSGRRLFSSNNDVGIMGEIVGMLGVPARKVLDDCNDVMCKQYFHKFPNGSYSFTKPVHKCRLDSRITSIFSERMQKLQSFSASY